MPQMIIANRLADGAVVFLADEERWDTAIEAGALIEEDAEAQRLLGIAKRDEARSVVLDPLLIQVTVEDGRVRPTEIRELIRAFGPSVRTDAPDGEPPHIPGLTPGTTHRREDRAMRVSKNTKE